MDSATGEGTSEVSGWTALGRVLLSTLAVLVAGADVGPGVGATGVYDGLAGVVGGTVLGAVIEGGASDAAFGSIDGGSYNPCLFRTKAKCVSPYIQTSTKDLFHRTYKASTHWAQPGARFRSAAGILSPGA